MIYDCSLGIDLRLQPGYCITITAWVLYYDRSRMCFVMTVDVFYYDCSRMCFVMIADVFYYDCRLADAGLRLDSFAGGVLLLLGLN